MRRGCIAIGDICCDGCGRIIRHPERYLAISEKDGVEVEEGETSYYCVDCCLKKGYARYREEKDEEILTFFPEK
ncbi:unnamed protein product [marine sediment metagenome]|uniref:Uncharacterized protein n=1 Tax=marine sediment metagenome TaxID=412755 RepID=X1Q452_9ZZZZ